MMVSLKMVIFCRLPQEIYTYQQCVLICVHGLWAMTLLLVKHGKAFGLLLFTAGG